MVAHFQRDSKGMFRFILSILFILAVSSTLSSLLSCRVSVQGEPYHQGPGPRPAHISGIEGPWLITAYNNRGRLEFYWTGNIWTGRILFDNSGRWEELTDIFIDPDPTTGRVQFICPVYRQQYNGTLSGNRIVGTFITAGIDGSFSWEAWRR